MGPNATDVLIRDATLEDVEGLVALLNPIIEARIYSAMVDLCTVASQRAYLEGLPARGIFHVAEQRPSGRIVGCQDLIPAFEDSRAFDHVATMATFVALDCHRRGIGAQLFAATFEAARRAGYEKVLVYVRADNEAGLRAYRGQGFGVVGTAARHAKIDGRYVDEVILERMF